jgi:antitoxin component of MazEF toxin-antitoxin module
MVITMERKIIQIGNSAGIIMSREDLQETGFHIGDAIVLNRKPQKIEIVPLRKKLIHKKSAITKSFVQSVDEFIQAYRPALEELAKR